MPWPRKPKHCSICKGEASWYELKTKLGLRVIVMFCPTCDTEKGPPR